jgi:hypothetical protein
MEPMAIEAGMKTQPHLVLNSSGLRTSVAQGCSQEISKGR